MKPELETLSLHNKAQSFHAFSVVNTYFEPYWHYHPELELTLITKGKGIRFVGDNISPFYQHDLVLVGKNLPHHWVSQKTYGKSGAGAIVVQFPMTILETFPECKSLLELFKKAAKGIQFLNPSCKLITMLTEFPKTSGILQISALIALFHELSQQDQQLILSSKEYNIAGKDDTKASKCTAFIIENLHNKLTVPLMAEKFHMSQPAFCRWFKKQIGLSFVTFLNTSRIESACHYLNATDLPIQQIAFTVGFESLSQFNRSFKRFKKMSPSMFKKKLTM